MPNFKEAADRTLAFSSLIDRYRGVISDLHKRNDALARSIRSFNVSSHGANRGPVVPKTAAPLGKEGVVFDRLENVVQIVSDGRKKTRGKLRMIGSRIKKCRR